MLDDNQVLIKDSCIIFDLFDLGLLQEFFLLKCQFCTTPQVISEITDTRQLYQLNQFVTGGLLKVDMGGQIETIQILLEQHSGLSFTDCSVLELSMRMNGIILTADKALRNIATKNQLQVRGMIWVFTLLLENNLITKEIALEKLDMYPKINNRVPKRELNDLRTYILESHSY